MSGQPLNAKRVVYRKERLFVHDMGNRSVQMFDVNGVHITELVREGEMGIRTIRNLLWLPDPEMILYCDDETSCCWLDTEITMKNMTSAGLR